MIDEKDRQILRELAKKQLDLFGSQKNQERIELWRLHSKGKAERPIVHIEVESFSEQLIIPRLQCSGEQARKMEYNLLCAMICMEEFDDDWVLSDYYPVGLKTSFIPFGIREQRDSAENSIGHHFKSILRDLEEDFHKLGRSKFSVDTEATLKEQEFCQDVIGDILPVKTVMGGAICSLTQNIVHIMSMEDMFCAMMDTPELFQKMIDGLSEDYNRFFDLLEEKGLLPTRNFEHVCQGTKAFTELLPENPQSTKDIWGYMDSQETVGISAELFHRLVFPAYKKLGDRFGLLSYGCCEPVHDFWEDISTFKNLKRISVSPWCNQELMGERLRGSDIIFHRKPSPNFIGIGALDEEGFRAHIQETLRAARGCTLEITQRDVYKVPSVKAVHRYIEIIRQEIENHW